MDEVFEEIKNGASLAKREAPFPFYRLWLSSYLITTFFPPMI